MQANFSNVDEYIAGFPDDVQAKLRAMRQVIREAAPDATEQIAYAMPAYKLNGPLVYFAAFKEHIGFYPAGDLSGPFDEELTPYKRAKGTVRLPIDQPLPLDLIRRIVEYRVDQNMQKAAAKKNSKKKQDS